MRPSRGGGVRYLKSHRLFVDADSVLVAIHAHAILQEHSAPWPSPAADCAVPQARKQNVPKRAARGSRTRRWCWSAASMKYETECTKKSGERYLPRPAPACVACAAAIAKTG